MSFMINDEVMHPTSVQKILEGLVEEGLSNAPAMLSEPQHFEVADGVWGVYDPMTGSNGYILRLYARMQSGLLDIAFGLDGRVRRALLGQDILDGGDAVTLWIGQANIRMASG